MSDDFNKDDFGDEPDETTKQILDLAKEIQELKKIKKQLQAQINFSKGRKPKEENSQKEGDSPEK